MSESSTPPPSSVERWVSWVALFGALALGWLLLWAFGWSIDFAADDGPARWGQPVRTGLAHAMTREPCERWDRGFFQLGMVAAAVAGVTLIARAIRRGGWWQVGLWLGFALIADALLMAQYVRLVPPDGPCSFD